MKFTVGELITVSIRTDLVERAVKLPEIWMLWMLAIRDSLLIRRAALGRDEGLRFIDSFSPLLHSS